MILIRILVLKGLIENVRIFARHVEGSKNVLADNLSRNRLDLFHENCQKIEKKMDNKPTEVPEAIWPVQKIWRKN